MPGNKIIVVDDDVDLLRIISLSVKKEGFEPTEFLNGSEASNFLKDTANHEEVAIVILDRLLPDMDGLDILNEFKANNPNNIPVLILSGLSSEKDIVAGLDKGAVDYITKPFSLKILMQKVHSLIGK
ncbi:MAG: putative transcriptional regulatory protein TcrX [Chlamydiia bacterium]|nr:putative transcriptional regulatory protein TcrX [Chlamydiia bacterium]